MPHRTERHSVVLPVAGRRRLSARPRPAAVSPGHPDLQDAARSSAADAGRRLEDLVAREQRRAEARRRSDDG